MSQVEHKSVTLKSLDEAEGKLTAVISTFQKDRDGDVMTKEAFGGSLGKQIPMVWSHDWARPIGKGSVGVSETGAIFDGEFFMDTEAGVEAFKTVKAMGDLQEFSIGFRILDSDTEKGADGWTRTIKDIELFEASPVLVGAAFNTGILAVKEATFEEGFPAALKALAPMLLSKAVAADQSIPMHEFMRQMNDLHAAVCSGEDCPLMQKAALDIPDLETPERKAQRAEIDRMLAAVKLEGA